MTVLTVLQLKIISTVALFILSILFGIVPYWMRNLKNSNRYLSWSSAFSGGIFFGAGMLHLFASADQELQPYIIKYNYPIAALCLCAGFLITLNLELIINAIFIKSNYFQSFHGHSHSHGHSHDQYPPTPPTSTQNDDSTSDHDQHQQQHNQQQSQQLTQQQLDLQINNRFNEINENSNNMSFRKIIDYTEPQTHPSKISEKQRLLDSSNTYLPIRYNQFNHIDIDKSGSCFTTTTTTANNNNNNAIINNSIIIPTNINATTAAISNTINSGSINHTPLQLNNNNNSISSNQFQPITNKSLNKSLSYRSNASGGIGTNIEVDEEPDIIIDYDDDYYYSSSYHNNNNNNNNHHCFDGRIRGNSASSESNVNNNNRLNGVGRNSIGSGVNNDEHAATAAVIDDNNNNEQNNNERTVLINTTSDILIETNNNNNNKNNNNINQGLKSVNNNDNVQHIHQHQEILLVTKKSNLLLPFLLVIALSIHSLFEGLAMGIQNSEIHVIDILVAIFAHKILASFALGVSTVTSSFDKPSFSRLFLLVLIFSLSSPIGSIIGMVIVGSGVVGSIVPSILQGVASGTFLYVAVVEVIPRELSITSDDILIKSILLLLGWTLMSLVAIWI